MALPTIDRVDDGERAPIMPPVKPHLRGWLHAGATPLVLASGIVLVSLAPTAASRWAGAIYALTALMLFGTSAVYHRFTWSPRATEMLRRMDHSNIYLIIAGSYTPIALLALEGAIRTSLLVAIWLGAAAGVIFRVVWIAAPRWLYTALYVVLGWSIIPFIGTLFAFDAAAACLTLAGGVLYTAGGIVYAIKKPNPNPTWFGFHEVFHSLTIAAWASQYVAISLLTYRQ